MNPTDRELDDLHARTRPDNVGPRYNRVPEAVGPIAGGGGGVRFAKVLTILNASNAAWTDHETDGFPSHVTAKRCSSDGTVTGDTAMVLLVCKHPKPVEQGHAAAFVAPIPIADDVVAYFPSDGVAVVPGTEEEETPTPLGGFVIPGVLDAVLQVSDVAPTQYQPLTFKGPNNANGWAPNWLQAHE